MFKKEKPVFVSNKIMSIDFKQTLIVKENKDLDHSLLIKTLLFCITVYFKYWHISSN